ncbi:MAG: glycosyltransferase family 4 protein [bacterium]
MLQVARQFHPCTGGVERFVMDLSHHLQRRGIRSDVLTLNNCFYARDALPTHDTVQGILVTRVPYAGGRRLFLAPGVLRFLSEYDLLHVHNVDFFAHFLSVTKAYHGKPIVVSTHGGFFHTEKLVLAKKAAFHTVTRLLLPRADQVVADSVHDRDLFARIVPNIVLIENGVDFRRLSGVHKSIDPGLLLYVGRLATNKRVDNLIRALGALRQLDHNARLALVGPDFDGLRPQLEALAASQSVADAVTFVGRVPESELAYWLGRAHLFVSASEYEGFGISVLEAMSAGTVPVVNPLPSFEGFIDDASNGFFTNFDHPGRAAGVLARVLQMDLETLTTIGQRAKQTAQRYAWENVVHQWLTLYGEVAS